MTSARKLIFGQIYFPIGNGKLTDRWVSVYGSDPREGASPQWARHSLTCHVSIHTGVDEAWLVDVAHCGFEVADTWLAHGSGRRRRSGAEGPGERWRGGSWHGMQNEEGRLGSAFTSLGLLGVDGVGRRRGRSGRVIQSSAAMVLQRSSGEGDACTW